MRFLTLMERDSYFDHTKNTLTLTRRTKANLLIMIDRKCDQ